MRIRVDPRVDFAFKLMLGSPEHASITIHFLNAILRLAHPIVSIEILNPLTKQDRGEDKLIVLDILARDSLGRLFNIEMQTRLPLSVRSRLVYYACKTHSRQIGKGAEYEDLCSTISICIVDRPMFPQATRWHHSFRLRCDQDFELVFSNDLEFHIIELPKFVPSSDNIRELSAEEKWMILFTRATQMEPDKLADLLEDDPLREALGVLEMISQSPEDLQFYEARVKFLMDERSKLKAARLEGLQEGREEGREEGRRTVIATLRMLEELLRKPISTEEALKQMTLEQLVETVAKLQQLVRDQLA